MFEGVKSVAVVVHDAGAASLAISLVESVSVDATWFASGPAMDLLSENQIEYQTRFQEVPDSIELFLIGTGWQSHFEQEAMRMSKKLGKISLAIIDAPFSILERFSGIDIGEFPDKILTVDSQTFNGVTSFYPFAEVQLIPDPRVEQIKIFRQRFFDRPEFSAKASILYLTEPVRNQPKSCLSHNSKTYFLNFMNYMAKFHPNRQIAVRVHPADKGFFSLSAFKRLFSDIAQIDDMDFIRSIGIRESVYGAESQGLRLAALAGIPSFSIIPRGCQPCRLSVPGLKVIETF